MDTPDVIELTNKRVYGILSKMHLRMQMDAISSQLKSGSQSKIFIAPVDAQKGENGTTINVFEVHLMV